MRIALKIDVSNRAGLHTGLPALLDMLAQYKVNASLFFSPDAFVIKNNPFRASQRKLRAQQAELISRIVASDHEVGLLPRQTRQWLVQAADATSSWTTTSIQQSIDDFHSVFTYPPKIFAASGWQVNPALLEIEDAMNFTYASDTRGKHPYYPELLGVRSRCPQLPTTLPTLPEVLLEPDVDAGNAHEYVYAESRYLLPAGHVYSASADVEGMAYLPIMEKLLVMWRGQEGSVRSLGTMFSELLLDTLPVHQIGWDRPGEAKQYMATQSVEL